MCQEYTCIYTRAPLAATHAAHSALFPLTQEHTHTHTNTHTLPGSLLGGRPGNPAQDASANDGGSGEPLPHHYRGSPHSQPTSYLSSSPTNAEVGANSQRRLPHPVLCGITLLTHNRPPI
jgi:hypothetical protein